MRVRFECSLTALARSIDIFWAPYVSTVLTRANLHFIFGSTFSPTCYFRSSVPCHFHTSNVINISSPKRNEMLSFTRIKSGLYAVGFGWQRMRWAEFGRLIWSEYKCGGRLRGRGVWGASACWASAAEQCSSLSGRHISPMGPCTAQFDREVIEIYFRTGAGIWEEAEVCLGLYVYLLLVRLPFGSDQMPLFLMILLMLLPIRLLTLFRAVLHSTASRTHLQY